MCADRDQSDRTALKGYVKVDISGVDGNILLGPLFGGQCCGDITNGMSPRVISMLPRETTKLTGQRSHLQLLRLGAGIVEYTKVNKGTEDREKKEPAACSHVIACKNEKVFTDSIIRPLRMKPLAHGARLGAKAKCCGKSSARIWYPCFSGANSPFKHTQCSVTRKKDNPSIDVCYKS